MLFRSAVFATALLSLSLPAFARGELSHARKWKTLLPSVRATTECMARGIVASPVALGHARQGNWLEAVKAMQADCAEVGRALVAEHDRLYGPGTGRSFVEGPYASDLPRALKARIGAKVDQAAESMNVEEAPASAPVTTPEALPQPPDSSPDPAAPVSAASADGAHAVDREDGSAGISLSADIASYLDRYRMAALNAASPADEVRSEQPSIPKSFWFICLFALGASLYAVVRGIGRRAGGAAMRGSKQEQLEPRMNFHER
jgi:hypothetical protein